MGDIDLTKMALDGGPDKLTVIASEETKALLLLLVQKQIEDFRDSLNATYFSPIADKAAGQQVQPLQLQIDDLSTKVSTLQGTLVTDMQNVHNKVGNVVEMGQLKSDINEVWNQLQDVQDVDLVDFHRRIRFLETGQLQRHANCYVVELGE